MNPENPEDLYAAWLDQRRREFRETDLSFQVMAAVRPLQAREETRRRSRNRWFATHSSHFGAPSTLVGAARLILFALLMLTPA